MIWRNHDKWNDIIFTWYIYIQLHIDVKEAEEKTKRMWKITRTIKIWMRTQIEATLGFNQIDFNEIKLVSNERP